MSVDRGDDLRVALCAVLGDGATLVEASSRRRYARYASTIEGEAPVAVCLPSSTEQVVANRVDRGVMFPVRVTYSECPGMPRLYLQEHARAPDGPFASVKILQQLYDGTLAPLELPENCTKRLLEYLNYGPQTRPFDCMDFGHFLADIPYAHGEFDPKHRSEEHTSELQ